MLVREYRPEDCAALAEIHAAQGFAYPTPDLSDPLFVSKLVLLDAGREVASPSAAHSANAAPPAKIVGAALLRLTAEAYLLLDPAESPRARWKALLALHSAAERDAWQRGLQDVHAWLPPPIAASFGKHIERLGWIRDTAWTPYCKKLSLNGGL